MTSEISHTPALDVTALSTSVKAEAARIGFELCGIAPATSPAGLDHFRDWLSRGYAGEMEYMNRRSDAYAHPQNVLDRVQSVIMLAVNYRSDDPQPAGAGQGLVSRYAWGQADYHDFLREKLKQLADFIHTQRPGCRTRGVVDTAPLLERDFARMAGLGWFGKNTLLINKRVGSWVFLSCLLTDVELDYDKEHETSHCGTCTRCLDACPTDAFVEPYVLDARKCISYLNIELREQIPVGLREGMGQWLFGCDVCQDVCPWNHKAPKSSEPAFAPLPELAPVDAVALLSLTDEQFRTRFHHTPLWRPRRAGLLRNAAIVLGNSGDRSAVPVLIGALNDSEPLIRGAVAWALGQLGGTQAVDSLQARIGHEDDDEVAEEIRCALGALQKTGS